MLSCVSGQCPLFIDVYHHGEEEWGADVLRVELVTKLAHSWELTQLVTTKDTKKSHSMTLDQTIQSDIPLQVVPWALIVGSFPYPLLAVPATHQIQ